MDKAKMEELKREITSIFTVLQHIEAPMIENNVAVMNSCLCSLKFISNALDEAISKCQEEAEPDEAEAE